MGRGLGKLQSKRERNFSKRLESIKNYIILDSWRRRQPNSKPPQKKFSIGRTALLCPNWLFAWLFPYNLICLLPKNTSPRGVFSSLQEKFLKISKKLLANAWQIYKKLLKNAWQTSFKRYIYNVSTNWKSRLRVYPYVRYAVTHVNAVIWYCE